MSIYITKGFRTAQSSNGLGTISTAVTAVITVNTSALDTQRRVVLYSSTAGTDMSAVLVTFTGTKQGGGSITEIVAGTSAGSTGRNSVQDFASLTTVAVSCGALAQPIYFGTSNIGSTPWYIANTCPTPFSLGFALTFSSTGVTNLAGQLEYTLEDINSPNPNSTYYGPYAFVSTSISTATGTPSVGQLNFPVEAWRLTLASTSATASAYLTALPCGLGN